MTTMQYIKYNEKLDRIERANYIRKLERDNKELSKRNRQLERELLKLQVEKRLDKEKYDTAIRRANDRISSDRKRRYEEKYQSKEKTYSNTYYRASALVSGDKCARCPFSDACDGECEE